ncbi:MAG TPA: hypothetical protein VHZ31_08890 [Solirubrobacteraceae bacterium]|nr:hypothetical protein [Solirubrobacteraceae bacterium]
MGDHLEALRLSRARTVRERAVERPMGDTMTAEEIFDLLRRSFDAVEVTPLRLIADVDVGVSRFVGEQDLRS